MDRDRDKMVESLISLTLEILFRLTGEDYTIVKKTSSGCCQAPVSEGWGRTLSPIIGPPPRPLILEEINREKIVPLTNKIIELLTEEVPIRCQDVTIYFSMEEWEYLEGHKDLYKDVMMGDHRPLTTPVKEERRTPERCPSTLLPQDGSEEHRNVPQNDQLVNLGEDLNTIYVTETYVRGEEQRIEDIPTDNRPGYCTSRSSEEHPKSSDLKANNYGVTEDTNEIIISDISSIIYTKNLSSDPLKQFRSLNSSQTVKQNKRYRRHNQTTHTGEKPFSCSECDKCFALKKTLLRHQRIHTGEKLFSCSECGKCFTQKSDLLAHHRIHTGEKPYSCSECDKCFSLKKTLLRHQRIHTGKKPFSCSECEKQYSFESELVRHQKIHTGEKPFSCSECGKCFTQKSDLLAHHRIHTGEKPFSCSECGKQYSFESEFVRHQRIHTGEKPFSCSECGKHYSFESELVRHQRIHTGEKPFSCSECGKCFIQKSDLLAHHRIHTGEKPFSCSECGKCFNRKSALVMHQKIHTGEKPFSCTECGKCFIDKYKLAKHEKIHAREKSFLC